jgi:hypothetical protein
MKGCCMGTDLRTLIADNIFPRTNLFGLELEKDFVDLGFELFGDDNSWDKDHFLIGDSLRSIPSDILFDYVYCGSVFHLLTEEQDIQLSKNIFKALKEVKYRQTF